jgi:hypothetical protein
MGCPVETAGDAVLSFEERAARVRAARELRSEIAALEAAHGGNPYTDFILHHGHRPSPEQAATIGCLMGVRVRAADGTLQPQPTTAEKAKARKAKHFRQTEADYIDQIVRFRCVLATLAQNDGDPADIIRYMDPLFGDAAAIREHLAHAVQWINRFAEEWDREQETHGGQGQV